MPRPTPPRISTAATPAPSSPSSRSPDCTRRVAPESIRARTIRTIDAVDFDYAAELGCTLRQISRADLKDDTLFADVGPCLVPTDSPFGRVQRNLNLVVTSGQYGGDMAFLGAGAGGDPTAVAVVSDLRFVAETSVRVPAKRDVASNVSTPGD